MDFLKQLLPAGAGGDARAAGSQQQGQGGLLADWQAYSGDVEAGPGAGPGAGSSGAGGTGSIARTAEQVGSSISSFFRSGYSSVSDGLSSIQAPSLDNT
jgi:hypothetical protein